MMVSIQYNPSEFGDGVFTIGTRDQKIDINAKKCFNTYSVEIDLDDLTEILNKMRPKKKHKMSNAHITIWLAELQKRIIAIENNMAHIEYVQNCQAKKHVAESEKASSKLKKSDNIWGDEMIKKKIVGDIIDKEISKKIVGEIIERESKKRPTCGTD